MSAEAAAFTRGPSDSIPPPPTTRPPSDSVPPPPATRPPSESIPPPPLAPPPLLADAAPASSTSAAALTAATSTPIPSLENLHVLVPSLPPALPPAPASNAEPAARPPSASIASKPPRPARPATCHLASAPSSPAAPAQSSAAPVVPAVAMPARRAGHHAPSASRTSFASYLTEKTSTEVWSGDDDGPVWMRGLTIPADSTWPSTLLHRWPVLERQVRAGQATLRQYLGYIKASTSLLDEAHTQLLALDISGLGEAVGGREAVDTARSALVGLWEERERNRNPPAAAAASTSGKREEVAPAATSSSSASVFSMLSSLSPSPPVSAASAAATAAAASVTSSASTAASAAPSPSVSFAAATTTYAPDSASASAPASASASSGAAVRGSVLDRLTPTSPPTDAMLHFGWALVSCTDLLRALSQQQLVFSRALAVGAARAEEAVDALERTLKDTVKQEEAHSEQIGNLNLEVDKLRVSAVKEWDKLQALHSKAGAGAAAAPDVLKQRDKTRAAFEAFEFCQSKLVKELVQYRTIALPERIRVGLPSHSSLTLTCAPASGPGV
jgi:hypothetical protein